MLLKIVLAILALQALDLIRAITKSVSFFCVEAANFLSTEVAATWAGSLIAGFAFLLLARDQISNRKEKKQEKADAAEEKKRSQAVKVTVWMYDNNIYVSNQSEYPIHNLTPYVVYADTSGRRAYSWVTTTPSYPGSNVWRLTYTNNRQEARSLQVLPPGATYILRMDWQATANFAEQDLMTAGVHFEDQARSRWTQGEEGLHPSSESYPLRLRMPGQSDIPPHSGNSPFPFYMHRGIVKDGFREVEPYFPSTEEGPDFSI